MIAKDASDVNHVSTEGRILVVDDNPADIQLTLEMFGEVGLHPVIDSARDGVEAVDHFGRVLDGSEPAPHIVLLDINMPRMNGFEVLSFIRQHPRLSDIPVLMLTSSAREGDRARARSLGALDYLIKPDNVGAYLELVSGLARYLPCAG